MLKLTAPVLRNAATSRARLQTGRFCALSPPENNALAQPPRSSKAAFWRFSPVQRTDLEGQQRVHLKRPRDVTSIVAYRWFCRLGLDGDVPDHSTFSKNRHGRFRESDLFRKLFETVVARCIKEKIVGGEAFGVDASMIVADACRRRGVVKVEDLDPTSSRAVAEYLSVLDDAAFGAATPKEPTSISPTDPAARYTAASDTPAFYAYSDNYLVDLKHAVIMDVEATTAVRQAEVGAAKRMIDRTAEQFDVTPSRLVGDAGYGSAEMVAWLADEREIEPHVKLIDKSERTDGTFSRSDFVCDPAANVYVCPGGKELKKYHRNFSKPRDGLTKSGTLLYFARKHDCDACALKPKCCPNIPARKIPRSIHEAARDKAPRNR